MTEQKREDLIVNKTIVSMYIASDKKALLFKFNDGSELIARTYGDCCSHSWIEHIELPTEFPAKVLSICELELNIPDLTDDDYECLAFYGFKISTDKGDIVIDYRNSSNGYYGGDLVFGSEHFFGGVYGQNISNEVWEEIK